MLTNWRVWILTSVAAVGGAYIIGVSEPVRAQQVTYTIDNLVLANDAAIVVQNGSIEYSNGAIDGGSLVLRSLRTGEGIVFDFSSSENNSEVNFASSPDGQDGLSIYLAGDLTGSAGQEVGILTTSDWMVGNSQGFYDYYFEEGGEVTDAVASTPEPTSSMATIIAVTFGLVVSGKRRKLSAREKKRTGYER